MGGVKKERTYAVQFEDIVEGQVFKGKVVSRARSDANGAGVVCIVDWGGGGLGLRHR